MMAWARWKSRLLIKIQEKAAAEPSQHTTANYISSDSNANGRQEPAGACQPIAIFTVSLTTHNKKKMGEFL